MWTYPRTANCTYVHTSQLNFVLFPIPNRFFLRCSPNVFCTLEIGKLRVQTGATSLRGTLTRLSQKGNIAHAGWKNAA
jgi:hypothetical protein